MSDKIEEIRARHMSETWPRLYELKVQIHDDREWLLAEVDRQRAEIERLRAALKGIDALNPDALDALVASDLRVIVAHMGDLAVKALEGKP